jgi:FlaA1/EpsC-like NDP-sugar epimerase
MEIAENAKAEMASQGFRDYSRPAFGRRSLFRVAFLTVVYSLMLVTAHWCAYLIRFEFHPDADQAKGFWEIQEWLLTVELVSLSVFGQFRSMLSYFSIPDARSICLACSVSAVASMLVWYTSKGQASPPRSIIVLSVLLDTFGLISLRMGFRRIRERRVGAGKAVSQSRHTIIIGAGDVGASLAKDMLFRRSLGINPVAFFDDDRTKWNTYVHGVPVLGRVELLGKMKTVASEAIIAMPSAGGKRIREVIQVLNRAQLKCEIVPSIEQMVNGDVRISQIRPVEIDDLLGRERVNLETDQINSIVNDKVVIVTGAGGSIGSELSRQISAFKPQKLLLVERCEVLLFQVEQELVSMGHGERVIALVADILNPTRMREIFAEHAPQIIFHAAAHKHVPMMEHQPFEAFYNNTIGTKVIADLSVEFSVDRFVFISSDKAINPTNAMGATKRLAELFLQATQHNDHGATKFIAVRFGNVLGSSGSVIPTFKKQIAAGGPLTVTHPDISRYFMTVREAVGLVLQSATQGFGGEIFVLDMGQPVKIVDLAHQLIELSGFRPGIDIEIRFTGLRPGEKLYEELTHDSEQLAPTEHPKIMRLVGKSPSVEAIRDGLMRLLTSKLGADPDHVKKALQLLVPEYTPQYTGSAKMPNKLQTSLN